MITGRVERHRPRDRPAPRERGASLVLGARRAEVVADVAARCEELGGEAISPALDVSDPALGRRARGRRGRAVRPDRRLDQQRRRLLGRPLRGHAARGRRPPALDQPRGRDRRLARGAPPVPRAGRSGTLINVSSMIGGLAGPYVSAYATAKWGVRGFSFALREELRDAQGIHVCVVRPVLGRHADLPPLGELQRPRAQGADADLSARGGGAVIARLIDHPRREVIVGPSGRALVLAHGIAPGLVDRIFGARAARNQFDGDERAAPDRGERARARSGLALRERRLADGRPEAPGDRRVCDRGGRNARAGAHTERSGWLTRLRPSVHRATGYGSRGAVKSYSCSIRPFCAFTWTRPPARSARSIARASAASFESCRLSARPASWRRTAQRRWCEVHGTRCASRPGSSCS